MKRSRRRNKNRQDKTTGTHTISGNIHDSKKSFSRNNSSLMISAYSLANSNFHSSLNTIASVILVTDSAFAFTAITLNIVNLFSSFMFIYALSISFYILSIVSNLKSKNNIAKYIHKGNTDISVVIDEIESSHKCNFYFIGIFVIISYIFLMIISEQFSSYIQI